MAARCAGAGSEQGGCLGSRQGLKIIARRFTPAGFSFLLRGRCGDRVLAGIALIAFVALITFLAFVPFLALRPGGPGSPFGPSKQPARVSAATNDATKA